MFNFFNLKKCIYAVFLIVLQNVKIEVEQFEKHQVDEQETLEESMDRN